MACPKRLAANASAHFGVDFACFYMLFHTVKPQLGDLALVSLAFLTYNTIAFGLQPLVGYLCDARPLPAARLGCLLTAAGVLLRAPWTALCVCAVGNALFHVGGGIDSLVNADGRMARGGVFVSTGALGVALGTLAGGSELSPYIPALLLLLALEGLRAAGKAEPGAAQTGSFDTAAALPYGAVLLLALLSVVIRAYAGAEIPMGWKTTAALALVPGIASCAGKASGGFLADRFGARRVGVLSLAVSVPLLLAGSGSAAVSALGIALFNMTMPITLCAVASKLPDYPGFAFGLCSLALLCGTVPTFFLPAVPGWMVALLVGISVICIAFSTKNKGAVL